MLCVVKISSSFFPSVEVTLCSVFLNKSIFSLQPARCWPFVPLHVNLTEHVIVESAVGGVLTGGGGVLISRCARSQPVFEIRAFGERPCRVVLGDLGRVVFTDVCASALSAVQRNHRGRNLLLFRFGSLIHRLGPVINRFGSLIDRFGSLIDRSIRATD